MINKEDVAERHDTNQNKSHCCHSSMRASAQTDNPAFLFTLSLLRVINFKFPLQPHRKYYITQYEELCFS